jgi:carbamate kinase
VYPLPLQTCVADTQGGMGYMIAESLNNELRRRKISMLACTIITTVEVAADDPAFDNPTKPIGGAYTDAKAAEMQARFGWTMVKIPGKGHRRTVPSPCPQRIIELDLIRELAEGGHLVIAAGGGGIPVTRTRGELTGVEAVIDKDRTSALLAAKIPAELLVIATEIGQVALNYRQPDEQLLDSLTVDEARRHLADGQFPPGSMGPKIEAAIDFIENAKAPSVRVVICALDELVDAVAGRAGTRIHAKGQ